MIDLRKRALPDCLVVDGERYAIDTDFRTWIAVDADVTERGIIYDSIFTKEKPDGIGWVPAALDFLACRNELPKPSKRAERARTVDFVQDGELIVAAFRQAYGIDLTDPALDMHWHVFLALFRGLPTDTLMAQVMGYRSWRKDSRKHDEVMREMRRRWELADKDEERENARVLELFNRRYS